jgi:diguanylate cyclase (GGDEF)-like protein
MDPDPVTSTAILRLIVIGNVAALVPLLGALVGDREFPSDPLLVAALAALLGGLTVAERELARQRDDPAGAASLPAWPVSLASLAMLTLAITLANSALPADVGWYGVMLVLPIMIAAFIGRPAFVALVTGAAVAGFVSSISAAHQHADHVAGSVFGFTSFAVISAGAAGMLARAITRDRDELACLAEVAAIAARATTIEAGFAGAADAIARGPLSVGRLDHVQVLRYDGPLRAHLGLATLTWHDDGPSPEPPGLAAAACADGVLLDAHGARIVAHDLGRVRYVLDIRLASVGSARRQTGREHRLWRAHLARLALHLRVLVERVHAVDELDQISPTDGLTGLPNRRAVLRHLELERSEAINTGGRLCVAFVDLDDHAEYVERFGRPEGDRLINDLATMLAARVRGTDLVARYDGVVFCLVLPTTAAKGALRLVDELHTWAALLRPGQPITFSAGVADWDGTEHIRSLLDRAERALHQARADGKDRTVLAPTDADSGDSTADHATAG